MSDESDLVNGLQDRIGELELELAASSTQAEELQGELADALQRVEDLEREVEDLRARAQPVGDGALRGLATTYRTALRNGHPDAAKHLETLLRSLGA